MGKTLIYIIIFLDYIASVVIETECASINSYGAFTNSFKFKISLVKVIFLNKSMV